MEQGLFSAGNRYGVVPDKTKDIYWKRKLEIIKNMKTSVKDNKKILNIAVLGVAGCGKSSFVHTAITSLREDKWRLYSKTRKNSSDESSITQPFTSFEASYYFKEELNVWFPTFIDVNGLENDNGDFNKAFLRALFDGKIREGEDLNRLYDLYKCNTDNNRHSCFENEISKRTEYLKIDRIIVVTSGDPSAPLPTHLFRCIRTVANYVREIPIFGVMTKKDRFKEDTEILRRIDDCLCHLGITMDSFKWIANYCPDIKRVFQMNYHLTVFPYIDVPVLCFLTQVISPKMRTYDHPPSPLEDSVWLRLLKTIIINVPYYVGWFFCLIFLLIMYYMICDCFGIFLSPKK